MTPAEKLGLIAAIALIVVGIGLELLDRWLNRPLTDYDHRCSRIDEELDEREAQRRCRPSGSVERIY